MNRKYLAMIYDINEMFIEMVTPSHLIVKLGCHLK